MDVLQQVAAVCLVVGLAVLAAALSKGASGRLPWLRWRAPGGGRMEVVQRVLLTPQHSICIVRIDNREITLGVHPGGLTVMKPEPGSESK